MAFANITELRQDVRRWSERNDLDDSDIDSFVALVENDYKDDIKVPANEFQADLTTNVNGEVGIPQDYLEAKHVMTTDSSGRQRIIYRKPFGVVVHGESWSGNTPLYFERRGFNLIFAPDPPEGTEITLIYYGLIPSLLDTIEGDNFVLDTMPSLYLFGVLKHVHEFTFNEERAAFYENKYEKAKAALVEIQRKAEFSGSPLAVFPHMNDNGYILP